MELRPRKFFHDVSSLAELERPASEILTLGQLVVLRSIPEIFELRRVIVDYIGRTGGQQVRNEIIRLFETKASPSDESISILVHRLKELRDSRYVSALFHKLIQGLRLPEPVLIDTGHFRLVFPNDHARLKRRTDLFELEDIVGGLPQDPELMLTGSPGRAHRDLECAHPHLQVNLWFCLHDVDVEETLLIYPDKYREQVSYYLDWDSSGNPHQSPYGNATQIPLKFGDALIFHSQMIHGSPIQAANANRLTVELRAAGATVDSNQSYRRLFANARNFAPKAKLVPRSSRGAFVDDSGFLPSVNAVAQDFKAASRQANTKQEVLNWIFATPLHGRQALDHNSPSSVLLSARTLTLEEHEALARWADTDPWSEDMAIAAARILCQQGSTALGRSVLVKTIDRTRNYLWVHEAVRQLIRIGGFQEAAIGLEKASTLAATSDVRVGRFAGDVPSANPLPNVLMPAYARRAAEAIRKRLLNSKSGWAAQHAPLLDYRLFVPGWTPHAAFRNGTIFYGQCAWLLVPFGTPFIPEALMDRPEGVYVGATLEEVLAVNQSKLGPEISHVLAKILEVEEATQTHNLINFLGSFYAMPNSSGPVDPFVHNILEIEGVLVSSTLENARRLALAAEGGDLPPSVSERTTGKLEATLQIEDEFNPELVVLVHDGYKGTKYNVIKYLDRHYGVHQAEGPFDLHNFRRNALYHPAFEAGTASEVEHILDEKIVGESSPSPTSKSATPRPGDPPPFIGQMDAGSDFLNYAFLGDRAKLAEALAAALRNHQKRIILVGEARNTALLDRALRESGLSSQILPWAFGQRLPAAIDNDGATHVFCLTPDSDNEWAQFDAWQRAAGENLKPLWRLILPFAVIVNLQSKFEYNSRSLAQMCRYYSGRATHAPALESLDQKISFTGRSVVEFGPSDGNHTGLIVKFGAKRIVCVEGRPENVIKLLAAKNAMGWNHVEIVADNFHAFDERAYGRFDIVYAHGVYYHTSSPFHFLDKLCRMGNNIFVGGWCATPTRPRGETRDWTYDGVTYHGQVYHEPHHFLSGIQSMSVYLEADSLKRFFSMRGFHVEEISRETTDEVTGDFLRILCTKP